MAVMNAADRQRTWAQFQRDALAPGDITKAQLQAAIDATDDWVDTQASVFNLALPVAFRTTATAAQKAMILCYVIMRRVGKLPTAEG